MSNQLNHNVGKSSPGEVRGNSGAGAQDAHRLSVPVSASIPQTCCEISGIITRLQYQQFHRSIRGSTSSLAPFSLKPFVSSCSLLGGVEPISYRHLHIRPWGVRVLCVETELASTHHRRLNGAALDASRTTSVDRDCSITRANVFPSSSSSIADNCPALSSWLIVKMSYGM